jgi:hypothetical protein
MSIHDFVAQLVWKPEQSDWTTQEGKSQPWKAFWPPDRINDPTIWERSEFPEVASWTFSPNQPFDRPWRKWTRSTRAKNEKVDNTDNGEHGKHQGTFPCGNMFQSCNAI